GDAEALMHVNEITERIIGLAIEVHRHLGPGLPEIAYERALCMELDWAGLAYRRQVTISTRARLLVNTVPISWSRTRSWSISRASSGWRRFILGRWGYS